MSIDNINKGTDADPMEGLEREDVMMADFFNRRQHAAPDVEAELCAFKVRHGIGKPDYGRTIMSIVAAAAAVVLLVVVVKGWRGAAVATTDTAEGLVAYTASIDIPDRITIDSKGTTTTVADSRRFDYSKPTASTAVFFRTITTPPQMTAEVELPDGTVVLLNSCTRLKFPSAFDDGERRVEVRGEACFKVRHDAAHPFVVEANGMVTKVTGTEFCVRAYDRANPSVTLMEGSVEVRQAEADEAQWMKPGQHAVLNNEEMTISDVDTYIYTAWTEDKFYFDNSTLLDIATELGRWYNVSVVFDNPKLTSTRLFLTADRSDDIIDIVESINMMKKAKMSFENNQIIIK
ncbi:MAG: FecR family protein [Prevotella sp.]